VSAVLLLQFCQLGLQLLLAVVVWGTRWKPAAVPDLVCAHVLHLALQVRSLLQAATHNTASPGTSSACSTHYCQPCLTWLHAELGDDHVFLCRPGGPHPLC
jgi:hypothetical protein